MLKIIYTNLSGTLEADISSVSPLLPVDYDTYAAIAAEVNFGSHWVEIQAYRMT